MHPEGIQLSRNSMDQSRRNTFCLPKRTYSNGELVWYLFLALFLGCSDCWICLGLTRSSKPIKSNASGRAGIHTTFAFPTSSRNTPRPLLTHSKQQAEILRSLNSNQIKPKRFALPSSSNNARRSYHSMGTFRKLASRVRSLPIDGQRLR